jgi:hypothetical protein
MRETGNGILDTGYWILDAGQLTCDNVLPTYQLTSLPAYQLGNFISPPNFFISFGKTSATWL